MVVCNTRKVSLAESRHSISLAQLAVTWQIKVTRFVWVWNVFHKILPIGKTLLFSNFQIRREAGYCCVQYQVMRSKVRLIVHRYLLMCIAGLCRSRFIRYWQPRRKCRWNGRQCLHQGLHRDWKYAFSIKIRKYRIFSNSTSLSKLSWILSSFEMFPT